MLERFALAALIATIAGLSAASAQTMRDWEWCKATEGVPLDLQIRGCTALIDSGKQPTEVLAAAYNYRGYSWHGKRQFERAIRDYSQAIRVMPDYADAYSNRGSDYNNLGRWDLAIHDLTEAIKLDPQESINFKARSYALAKKGEYKRAFADLEHAVKLNPHDAEAAYYLQLARQAQATATPEEITRRLKAIGR